MTSKDEYLMLRNELLETYNIVNSTRSILYVFVAGIISYAFVNDKIGLLLIPYVAIIPMYLIAIDYTRDMYRIATYLQIFHEGDTFNWETRQYEINYNVKNKMPRFHKIFHIPYIITSLTCFVCFIYKLSKGKISNIYNIFSNAKNNIILLTYLILSFVELIIVLIIFIKFKNMSEIQQKYIKAWNELKCRETRKIKKVYNNQHKKH